MNNKVLHMGAYILLFVGGVNWGLVGLGMLLNQSSWNVVNVLLGGVPVLEAVVYVLVGVSAFVLLFGCRCGQCVGGVCVPCGENHKEGESSNV